MNRKRKGTNASGLDLRTTPKLRRIMTIKLLSQPGNGLPNQRSGHTQTLLAI